MLDFENGIPQKRPVKSKIVLPVFAAPTVPPNPTVVQNLNVSVFTVYHQQGKASNLLVDYSALIAMSGTPQSGCSVTNAEIIFFPDGDARIGLPSFDATKNNIVLPLPLSRFESIASGLVTGKDPVMNYYDYGVPNCALIYNYSAII